MGVVLTMFLADPHHNTPPHAVSQVNQLQRLRPKSSACPVGEESKVLHLQEAPCGPFYPLPSMRTGQFRGFHCLGNESLGATERALGFSMKARARSDKNMDLDWNLLLGERRWRKALEVGRGPCSGAVLSLLGKYDKWRRNSKKWGPLCGGICQRFGSGLRRNLQGRHNWMMVGVRRR